MQSRLETGRKLTIKDGSNVSHNLLSTVWVATLSIYRMFLAPFRRLLEMFGYTRCSSAAAHRNWKQPIDSQASGNKV